MCSVVGPPRRRSSIMTCTSPRAPAVRMNRTVRLCRRAACGHAARQRVRALRGAAVAAAGRRGRAEAAPRTAAAGARAPRTVSTPPRALPAPLPAPVSLALFVQAVLPRRERPSLASVAAQGGRRRGSPPAPPRLPAPLSVRSAVETRVTSTAVHLMPSGLSLKLPVKISDIILIV